MQIARYLKDERIELELATRPDPSIEEWTERLRRELKEEVLSELAALLARSDKIVNASRLRTELILREGKATTAIGHAIAIPHLRSLQARELVMAFGRSSVGIDFDAPDDVPVRIFIAMVAPPYEDRLYLQVYKRLAEALSREGAIERLLEVESPGEVIRILSDEMGRG